MKKRNILISLIAIATLTSCYNSDGLKKYGTPQNHADSIAFYLGSTHGFRLSADFDTIPPEQIRFFSRDRLFDGVKKTLLTDTTHQSILMGYTMAAMIDIELNRFALHGAHLNRPTIVSAYKEVFIQHSIDSISLRSQSKELSNFIRQIQQPDPQTLSSDDINYYSILFGHTTANRFNKHLNETHTASGEKIDPDHFFEGLKTMLDVDPNDKAYLAGLNLGNEFLSTIISLRPFVQIDRQQVLFFFHEALFDSRRLDKIQQIVTQSTLNRLIQESISTDSIPSD